MDSRMESSSETRRLSSPDSEPSSPSPPSSSKTYSRKYLINKVNYINFVDGTITATFRHNRFATTLPLQVKPLPCTDHLLSCLWTDTENIRQKLQSHDFLHLLIADGQKSLLVEPETVDVTDEGLKIGLPEKCTEINSRKIRRYTGQGVSVQLVQNGTFFQGELVDFSPVSLNVLLRVEPPETFQWINPAAPARVVLSGPQGTIFSGEFSILNQSCGQSERSFVLLLTDHQIRKFKPKKHRSTRQRLIPSPNISFIHPLSGRPVDLKVTDLSGSGFSVEEDSFNSVLVPGLIIPEMHLVFAEGVRLKCKAQVIYRKECILPSQKNRVRCGIAILDMKIEDQVKLLGTLYQANDEQSYLSNQVNPDSLWEFFFETGFIYPEKYSHIQSNKVSFRNVYHKLYYERPNIARHFVYQDNGKILAHMSMIRFYKNSWLIHHHASQKYDSNKGGLVVLGQISRYVNEVHRLYSAKLDYVFGFFRPENRFPRRYFGGAAAHINNPKACSIDSFAYLHFHKSFDKQWNIGTPWNLNQADDNDLRELNRFLEHTSGGLMAPALNLEPGGGNDEELVNEYQAIGLNKERYLFSLKIKNSLKAIVIVNVSDLGLNLSDINNSIKIIVLEPEDLGRDIIYLMLSLLCAKFGMDQIPVLIYPHEYAENRDIPFEKIYNLWILNMQNLDDYFDFCKDIILAR
jgi:hypothetical protein